MLVTVCTPTIPEHECYLDQCIQSVQAQGIDLDHLIMLDEQRRGPGWVRNALLQNVRTPFVVFLDADDWLDPAFMVECLNAYQPGRYVYTDWYQGDTVIRAPHRAWCNNNKWHVVTTLLPTDFVRSIKGFNSSLDGMEDTDLYIRLKLAGLCGVALHKPLFHYRQSGGRGRGLVETGRVHALKEHILDRYSGYNAACCDEERE